MANSEMKACPCGSIWFWSKHIAGALLCTQCHPPVQPIKQGPGIIQPDGKLLTGPAVTKSILELNRQGTIAQAARFLGPAWRHVSSVGLLISPRPPQKRVLPTMSACDVPSQLVIGPGDRGWVSRADEDAAILAHAQLERAARPMVEKRTVVKGDVSDEQAKRKARSPKRSSKQKTYPTDLAEL